ARRPPAPARARVRLAVVDALRLAAVARHGDLRRPHRFIVRARSRPIKTPCLTAEPGVGSMGLPCGEQGPGRRSHVATAVVDDRELIQAMRGYDGFVIGMSNPAFLIPALGGSVISLGGWGAIIVWGISIVVGALHNNIYAELESMFPKLSGGVAIFGHEAWKRYTTLVGPV